MIIKKIRAKNFFSIGNDFLEIDLLKYKQSVLHGANGAGKSTMPLNSITFCLFNKTIKNVKKTQVVNSINGKNCVVECELSANGKEYLVRRGVKPNLFEVHENGVLLDQTAVLDYQDFLENNILKCSYRTFIQTSIISVESYIPFMELPAAQRRSFVEDILDINIFTTMNQLVKAKISKNKEELRLLDVSIKGIKDKIILLKNHVDTLEAIRSTGLDVLDSKQAEYELEIDSYNYLLSSDPDVKEFIRLEMNSLKEQWKKHISITTMIADIKSQIRAAEKDLNFFNSHTECPTCRQGLDKDHSNSIIEEHTETTLGLVTQMKMFEEELATYSHIEQSMEVIKRKEIDHNAELALANSTIIRLKCMIKEVEAEKLKLVDSSDISEQRDSMKKSAKEAMLLQSRITEINEEQDYNSVMLELFKDSGIKSKIVDQYLPTINMLVNTYLEKLDFFVSFNLDSEFNETIKSRHRDIFTYSSFSAGQKKRIDIALLLTFRQIAKMKNSFSCNLLGLDEFADGSTDLEGIELMLDIFDTDEFKDTNLVIISHGNKDLLEQRFDGSLEFYTRDGFTQIKERE